MLIRLENVQSVKFAGRDFYGTAIALCMRLALKSTCTSAEGGSKWVYQTATRLRENLIRQRVRSKETVGRAIDDRDLEAEGRADQTGGNIQEGFGKAKRKVGEAIEDIGEKINAQ